MIGILRRFEERRREQRHAIEMDARSLIATSGSLAYYEARDRARQHAPPGRARHPHWSAVAKRIKALTGLTTGWTGADRYPGP